MKFKISLLALTSLMISFTILSCQDDAELNYVSKNNQESDVISEDDFEKLKSRSLDDFNIEDHNLLFQIDANVDLSSIHNILLDHEGSDENIDYESVLGEHYHESYFQQLNSLLSYSKNIIQSDLFNTNSEIIEREIYVQRILRFVFLNSVDDTSITTLGDCEEHRAVCEQNALDNHTDRMVMCAATAAVAGILTGGPGAATGVLCAVGSSLQWENDMEACHDHYEICVN
jgi:hypothetical protein